MIKIWTTTDILHPTGHVIYKGNMESLESAGVRKYRYFETLNVPSIVLKNDARVPGEYTVVDGLYRTSRAAKLDAGINAVVIENEEDINNLPEEFFSEITKEQLKDAFRNADNAREAMNSHGYTSILSVEIKEGNYEEPVEIRPEEV